MIIKITNMIVLSKKPGTPSSPAGEGGRRAWALRYLRSQVYRLCSGWIIGNEIMDNGAACLLIGRRIMDEEIMDNVIVDNG